MRVVESSENQLKGMKISEQSRQPWVRPLCKIKKSELFTRSSSSPFRLEKAGCIQECLLCEKTTVMSVHSSSAIRGQPASFRQFCALIASPPSPRKRFYAVRSLAVPTLRRIASVISPPLLPPPIFNADRPVKEGNLKSLMNIVFDGGGGDAYA